MLGAPLPEAAAANPADQPKDEEEAKMQPSQQKFTAPLYVNYVSSDDEQEFASASPLYEQRQPSSSLQIVDVKEAKKKKKSVQRIEDDIREREEEEKKEAKRKQKEKEKEEAKLRKEQDTKVSERQEPVITEQKEKASSVRKDPFASVR